MHALASPVFTIVGVLSMIGLGVVSAIGIIRRPDPAKYREIWLKFGVHIGVLAGLLGIGALGSWAMLPVVLFAATRAWMELLRALSHKYGPLAMPNATALLGGLACLGGLSGTASGVLFGAFLATWVAVALPLLVIRRPPPLLGTLATLAGMVWISMPLGFFLALADRHYGAYAFLVLLLMTSDGLAEGLGRLFGKRPIWPGISPNKTWGGSIGGALSTVLIGGFLQFLLPDRPLWQVLMLAVGVALLGPVGDLIASSIKREVGIKDFGQILPEHGGVLDRIDSLLFTVPLFYGAVIGLGGAV